MENGSLLLREAPHPPSAAWVLQAAAVQLCTTPDALQVVAAALAGLEDKPVNPSALFCQVWSPTLRALTPAQLVLAWRLADYLLLPVTAVLAREVLQRKCRNDAQGLAEVMAELVREGLSREHVVEVDKAHAAVLEAIARLSAAQARFDGHRVSRIDWVSPTSRGSCTVETGMMAVAWGHLENLKATAIPEGSRLNHVKVMRIAALNDHIHVLEWVHGQCVGQCVGSETISDYAALGGHVDVLEWLRERGFPMSAGMSAGTPRAAATWRCCSGWLNTVTRLPLAHPAPSAAATWRRFCLCATMSGMMTRRSMRRIVR